MLIKHSFIVAGTEITVPSTWELWREDTQFTPTDKCYYELISQQNYNNNNSNNCHLPSVYCVPNSQRRVTQALLI